VRKRWIILVVVLVIGIILLAAGIYLYGEYMAALNVKVGIAGVGAQDVGLTSATILLKVNFTNPSSYSFPSFSSNFTLYLGNYFVGNGSISNVSIQANSSSIHTVYFPFNYSTAAASAVKALVQGQYNATVTGTVHAQLLSGIIPVKVHFRVVESCSSLSSSSCKQNVTYSL